MTGRGSSRSGRRRVPAATVSRKPASRPIRRSIITAVQRHPLPFALALAGLHLIFAWLSFLPTPFTGGDNAGYIALARSLLEQGAYREIYDPAALPHTQYPPAFPALLAFAMLLGLHTWVQLKAVMLIFAAAGVAATFLWIRRRRRPLLALSVGVLLATSPGLLELGHWILSDVPFFAFTLAALWGWERLRPRDRGRLALALVFTTLAYFTRSAGLPLVIAAFAWLILRRRWTQLAISAGVILPLAFLWWLRARSLGGVDYVSQFWMVNPYDPAQGTIGFSGLFTRAFENAANYVVYHVPILMTGRTNGFAITLGVILLVLALASWVRRLRRPGVPELMLPLYLGLLCVWPSVWSGERFLLPAFPLLLYHGGDGVMRLARVVQPRFVRPLAAAAVLVLLGAQTPGLLQQVEGGTTCGALYRMGDPFPCLSPEWRDYFAVATWADTTLPAEAVVITRKPRLWYVISGRTAVIFPFTEQSDSFFAAADAAGARYLVVDYVDMLTQIYAVPVVLRRAAAFCMMHATADVGTAVLGIRDGARALPDSASEGAGAVFSLCPVEYFRDAAGRGEAARRLGLPQ